MSKQIILTAWDSVGRKDRMISAVIKESCIEGETGRACNENKADALDFDIFLEVPLARA